MANREMIFNELQRLADVHRTKLNESLFDEYFDSLCQYDPEDLKNGIKKLVTTTKWFPKIPEIIEAVEEAIITRLITVYGRGNMNALPEKEKEKEKEAF